MGSPADLSLDCKPHNYSTLLKSFGDQTDQTQKLEDFVARLEEERVKIDAFKRELPLCMQLLTKEMEASRQQLQTFQKNQGTRMVLEEFIPLKNSSSEGTDKKASNVSEKVSWMTTAQLWSQSNDGTKQQGISTTPKEIDHGPPMSPILVLDNKQRNGRGGAFLPFSKERNASTRPTLQVLPELALATTEKEMEDKICIEPDINGTSCSSRRENPSNGGTTTTDQTKGAANNPGDAQALSTTQTHRKARRCWSPDLHRRFVNALQMLGGSQVATPKQIRELMKVDGLTNDEVKSHLQKYRLHTRRPSPSPQTAGASGPQLVVLGGIWVPPEYATAAAAHTAGQAIYSAHPASHASIHYSSTTPAVPQDFYPPPPPHHSHLHHTLHHPHQQHHLYKASSQTHSSPESDGRPGGNDSGSIEDGKSQSSSWNKGDSGENGGERQRERKGLASLRDDGANSNGSEITLKF